MPTNKPNNAQPIARGIAPTNDVQGQLAGRQADGAADKAEQRTALQAAQQLAFVAVKNSFHTTHQRADEEADDGPLYRASEIDVHGLHLDERPEDDPAEQSAHGAQHGVVVDIHAS